MRFDLPKDEAGTEDDNKQTPTATIKGPKKAFGGKPASQPKQDQAPKPTENGVKATSENAASAGVEGKKKRKKNKNKREIPVPSGKIF